MFGEGLSASDQGIPSEGWVGAQLGKGLLKDNFWVSSGLLNTNNLESKELGSSAG